MLGYGPAVGKYVKVNDTWMQVVGVLHEQLMAGSQSSGGAMQDINNIIYIPLNTLQYRFWDQSAWHEGRAGRDRTAAEGRQRTALKSPRW